MDQDICNGNGNGKDVSKDHKEAQDFESDQNDDKRPLKSTEVTKDKNMAHKDSVSYLDSLLQNHENRLMIMKKLIDLKKALKNEEKRTADEENASKHFTTEKIEMDLDSSTMARKEHAEKVEKNLESTLPGQQDVDATANVQPTLSDYQAMELLESIKDIEIRHLEIICVSRHYAENPSVIRPATEQDAIDAAKYAPMLPAKVDKTLRSQERVCADNKIEEDLESTLAGQQHADVSSINDEAEIRATRTCHSPSANPKFAIGHKRPRE